MKPELGQVFTPPPIAKMMAEMLRCRSSDLRLLDAGAGIGSLTQAVVESLCRRPPSERPERLAVTAYEIDPDLIAGLQRTLNDCHKRCAEAGIGFSAEVICRDFLEAAAEQLTDALFSDPDAQQFNCVVLNPPYRKIRVDSSSRRWLRHMGIETTNLYTGFLAAAIRLMEPGGEIVAITPRSFCSGAYFKPFRRDLLNKVSLDRLHLFESRQDTFRDAAVLQETLILHAVRAAQAPVFVFVSGQAGGRDVPFSEVVSPDDPDTFIRIVPEAKAQGTAGRIARLPCCLEDLGLSISTGRVVDFRARTFLRTELEPGTAPLLYPGHLAQGRVRWPRLDSRRRSAKPSYIFAAKETETLLVPNANYVLLRRFSTKEEKKRLVATVFEAGCVPGDWVGFENHLNYFHCRGAGMDLGLARGLTVFLNSTPADSYFRQFNGHTQVNATDLRSFRYPSVSQLMLLGTQVEGGIGEQPNIDILVDRMIDAVED